ncbi:MAG TPA: hypothetical protein VNN10_00680 [Dehalococcoidia bacterium]|nr:hypothetical protein [Dehalococcoidia bacterium]
MPSEASANIRAIAVIEPEEQERMEGQAPNVATVAVLGFMAGLVLWVGGACLVLGSGGDDTGRPLTPRNISTAPAARPTATTLPNRTNCAEIRGTEYRSEAERQWFIQNCT